MSTRVLIVEDQRIVRELLAAMLAAEPGASVVGEARTGGEALDLAASLQPDLVLLDISLPDMDGIAVMRSLRAAQPQIRVIALSVHDEPRYIEGMIDAGANGYVLKSAALDELRTAMRAIRSGQVYLSPELRQPSRPVRGRHAAAALGRRERQVLALLAEGKHSAAMARQLGISAATVDVHRRNIMRKLGLHTIAELTKFAIREGLTSL